MSNQPQPDRTLSEISHLFLSSVREKQTRGAARPLRRPPGSFEVPEPPAADSEIDLTPAEFAQVVGESQPPATSPAAAAPAISALLATHFGPRQLDRARQYAAHLAGDGLRVALVEIDSSEFRLWTIEPSAAPHTPAAADQAIQTLDARKMTEALHELACDVDHWLVLVPSPRLNEARALLRQLPHWVLLASCQEQGVVAAYRTLKGLRESRSRNDATAALPKLSLAILDALDSMQATGALSRLAAVAEQFLDWEVESRRVVSGATLVTEHLVADCRATHDKAQLAAAPQWQVVSEFIDHLKKVRRTMRAPNTEPRPAADAVDGAIERENPVEGASSIGGNPPAPMPAQSGDPISHDSTAEVIDLPGEEDSAHSIAAAMLRGDAALVECPLRPPMCPQARLAVSRERRLVLVAVAGQGLADLRAIGLAYRWLIENRPLIAMAVPQVAIDAHQLPRLHLLVDHADLSADLLQPILQSSNVSVLAYRKLRWGNKMGLLLDAA